MELKLGRAEPERVIPAEARQLALEPYSAVDLDENRLGVVPHHLLRQREPPRAMGLPRGPSAARAADRCERHLVLGACQRGRGSQPEKRLVLFLARLLEVAEDGVLQRVIRRPFHLEDADVL